MPEPKPKSVEDLETAAAEAEMVAEETWEEVGEVIEAARHEQGKVSPRAKILYARADRLAAKARGLTKAAREAGKQALVAKKQAEIRGIV